MRRLTLSVLLLWALLCVGAASASASATFQLGVPGGQVPEDPNVDGFRLVLLNGKNENVSGFDLGVISLSESGNTSGFSMIWGMGKVTGRSSGLASGFVNLHSGQDSGVNAAFINSIKTMTSGLNVGFVNVTEGHSSADLSGIGISGSSGVQLGFVNITKKIEGVQIGFLNFAENGIFPVFPIFNIPKR